MSTCKPRPLITLFALVGIALTAFVGVGYAMGWIEFHNDEDSAAIKFNRSEAGADTQLAVDQAENVIDESGEALQDASESLSSEQDTTESDLPDSPEQTQQ